MEIYITVFLLFFAILAFGWFYLQRAKARDAAKADVAGTDAPGDDHAAAPPAEEAR